MGPLTNGLFLYGGNKWGAHPNHLPYDTWEPILQVGRIHGLVSDDGSIVGLLQMPTYEGRLDGWFTYVYPVYPVRVKYPWYFNIPNAIRGREDLPTCFR